jgi:hypothetical protein
LFAIVSKLQVPELEVVLCGRNFAQMIVTGGAWENSMPKYRQAPLTVIMLSDF